MQEQEHLQLEQAATRTQGVYTKYNTTLQEDGHLQHPFVLQCFSG